MDRKELHDKQTCNHLESDTDNHVHTSKHNAGRQHSKDCEDRNNLPITHKAFISASLDKLETLVKRLRSVLPLDRDKVEDNSLSIEMSLNERISSFQEHHSNRSDLGSLESPLSEKRSETVNLNEVRTILSDIEVHLVVLKDIEDRHALVCEDYGRKIQTRENAILSTSKQLTRLGKHNATLQAELLNLQLHNRQLEYEINLYKQSTSNPVKTATTTNVHETSVSSHSQSLEEITLSMAESERATCNLQTNFTDTDKPITPSVEDESVANQFDSVDDILDDSEIQNMIHTLSKRDADREAARKNTSILSDSIHANLDKVRAVKQQSNTPEVEKLPKIEINASDEEDQESEPLLTAGSPLPKFITDLACLSQTSENVGSTTTKAYEYFVKMQQDLGKLMKKEQTWRVKFEKLETELADVNGEKEEQDYKLSEVQYELDILKHNYNLEIESFSTAVNERETLIEKLQEKMESLKKRYIMLDEKLQEAAQKELGYQTKIEEYEGRVKYEQLQREAGINVRVAELEKRLRQMESEYQVEINNLRTDISCKISIEKELRKQLEELEKSSSSGGLNGSVGGINTMGEEDASAIYYKAQVDALFKQIEREKQDKQSILDKFSDELRFKEKQFDHLKEEARKDKDARERDKSESDQKLRKLLSKFKIKEREILALQEKLQLLNDKFAKHRCYLGTEGCIKSAKLQPINESLNETNDGGGAELKSDEQIMAEVALLEAKLLDLKGKLDDAEDKCNTLGEQLNEERNKRRDLETHFLGSINYRYNGGVSGGVSHRSHSSATNDYDRYSGSHQSEWLQSSSSLLCQHRNSATSLSLLMDDHNEKDVRDVWLVSGIGRYLQRQRDIFTFGSGRQKLGRIVALVYIVLMHYVVLKHFVA